MKKILKKILPDLVYTKLRTIKNKTKNFYPYHFIRYYNLLNIDYKITNKLSFGTLENKFFQKKLNNSKYYLEYGSGNSTVLASQQNKKYLSIESDKNFYKYMVKKINTENFYFIDFGVVGFYSYPYFFSLNREKAIKYCSGVLNYLKNKKKFPDLILIDGRYRVLAGLYVFKFLLNCKSKFNVIIDDYYDIKKNKINRNHYSILDKFFYIKKVGRFGVATKIKKYNKNLLIKNLSLYSLDPR